jgi:hypothetical protein
MRILLLGEFSAVHKNLKEGLVELGHEITIAADGDGYKKIPADIDLSIKGNFFARKFNRIKRLFYLVKLVKNYDLVQLINPFIFYDTRIPNLFFFNKLIRNSKKFYVLAAGDDSYFWKFGRKKLLYGPFDDYLKYDRNDELSFYMETSRAFKINKYIADSCDGIIPIMYEYEISYSGHRNLLKTIPIPMNIKKIQYEENIIHDKLVVFHGLNRYGFKGTRHVEEAFKILKEKYPDKLELIIDGHMSLDKYLAVMRRVNVVIDQTNSYSLGVNGVYAMAMGKVVLGGAEPESLESLGVNSSPVINIKPNADSIVKEVEKLIYYDKEQLKEIGFSSRKFVERVHNNTFIAKKYIKIWNSLK